MAKIGEVDGREAFVIQWKITNFFSLSSEVGAFYDSPLFSFDNATWYVKIFPNGSKRHKSEGYIDLFLCRNSSGPPIHLEYSIRVKVVDEKVFRDIDVFPSITKGIGCSQFLNRTKLLEMKSSDTLNIVCKMMKAKSIEVPSSSISRKCTYCKQTLESEFISLQCHENCIDRIIKCPDCFHVVLLNNWLYDHECTKKRTEGVESLCQDFKNVLLDGCDHDLILKIDDREFRVHKDVLRARSRIFKAMLSHDMAEKNSGIINVSDCDPQSMEQFLFYIYSGKVESVDENNMSGLYYISDKYEMNDLKEKCSNFIKKALCITNFCNVVQLAINHSDSNLLDFATEYFTKNMLDILRTVEWQSFMKDNSTVANELMIKSCEKKK